MIGFIIGTVCLIGLVKVFRHGRRFGGGCGSYRGGACGGGFGRAPFGGHRGGWGGDGGGPPWARRGREFGKRFALRWLFEALDTTPGQEKVIAAAVEEAKAAGEAARSTMQKARADIARAVRGDTVDEAVLAEASARLDASGQTLREAISRGLTAIHAVLDEDQRKRFSDLIADGPGFFGGGHGHGHQGPYRDHGSDDGYGRGGSPRWDV